MKMWKKLMVPVLVIVLTSALMGAQYVSVQTDATVSVETDFAAAQIMGADGAVDGDSDFDTMLERDEDGFQVNFGTWGEQNTFESTATFGIVNAGGDAIRITGANVDGDGNGDISDHITIWLHGAEHERDLTEDNAEEYWPESPEEDVVLTSIEDPYNANEMTIQYDVDGDTPQTETATLEGYDINDDTYNVWEYDTDQTMDFDFSTETEGNANAVWVRVEVDLQQMEDDTDYDGTITFDIEDY